MPPKAMEVLTSDLAPTALALTRLALKQLEEELDSAREDLKDQDGGRMECGVAYAGTEINMGGAENHLAVAVNPAVDDAVRLQVLPDEGISPPEKSNS